MTARGPGGGEPIAEARLVALLGADVVEALWTAFGGRRLYVPHEIGAAHPIAATIGLEAARILAQREGGAYLHIPLLAAKRARILELAAQGQGPEAIRRQLHCTRRHVQKVLKAAREGAGAEPGRGAQLKLPI